MKKLLMFLIWIIVLGCSHGPSTGDSIIPELHVNSPTVSSETGSIPWGYYQLEIARDGSYVNIIPDRAANGAWGFHMNVVKFLEVAPCTNCLSISNIHMLPEGDLSMDVAIKHPFQNHPEYTGFDVRGIIMFPCSQLFPDDELRLLAGWLPFNSDWPEGERFKFRWSSYEKGDAELMNTDGYTLIWAPDHIIDWYDLLPYYILDEGFDIFGYYQGKYASGEHLGTLNGFKRFHSNEARHMFEAGQTVTRTYIIRPPSSGPIHASYAIYAHWAPPTVTPVLNPEIDFPPEANSMMPYEFEVYQDAPLDPDAPADVEGEHIFYKVKVWNIGIQYWHLGYCDMMGPGGSGGPLYPHPNGTDDEYYRAFSSGAYTWIPGMLPGDVTYLFLLEVFDPDNPSYPIPLGTDFYITKFYVLAPDGEW